MDPQAVALPEGLPVDGSFTLLIVYASIALSVSFLCSIAEAVLLSASSPFPSSASRSASLAFVLLEPSPLLCPLRGHARSETT